MKLEAGPLLQPEAPPTAKVYGSTPWRVALPLVIAAVIAILGLYLRTAESIAAIWSRSETFAHGFLIVPICVVLIWNKRRELAAITPSPDYLGFVLLAAAGIGWIAAAAGNVQVVQQLALVSMFPATVLAVTGRRVVRALAFPLAFLFLGVPMGESLIPGLMNWTADFTVAALRLTGIPVFREGNFFTIPSGNWSVVEGCSGLRYLIASITVGVLYAYLNYQSLWKRALFVGLSVIVPIIANGMRAYMIVMIAHLSDMKLALGVDHYIYGWVFFGIVMLLLFWAGSFWRDDLRREEPVPSIERAHGAPVRNGRMVAAAAGTVALAAAWPLYALHLDRSDQSQDALHLDVPSPAQGWTLDAEPLTDWRPRYEGASANVFQTYRKDGRAVALYLGYYPHQRPGAELVTSTNIMVVQKHPVWSNVGESHVRERTGDKTLDLRLTRLLSPRQRLLVWDWFRISDNDLTNPYVAKIYLARNKLFDRGDAAAAVIVATPYEEQDDVASETLAHFVREMKPSIDAALDRAVKRTSSPSQ